jgi:hypothetical protein
MTAARVLFSLSLMMLPTVLGAEGPAGYISTRPADPNGALMRLASKARPFETQRLADGSLFVVVPSDEDEPAAMVAQIIEQDGTVIPLRAGEWVPRGFIQPGTAGQIFFGTLLDDRKTLAVSFGWTNAKGRNLNGIAILERTGGDWSPKNVIVLDGAVRSLTSAPDGGLLVVNTRFTGAPAGKNWLYVTLFGTDGRIRAMFTPRPHMQQPFDRNAAMDVAFEARLQRVDAGSFVFIDPKGQLATVFNVRQTGPCTGAVVKQPDGFFLYPSYATKPCASIEHFWGGGFHQPPIERKAKVRSLRLVTAFLGNDRQSMRSVWSGVDERGTPVVVVAAGALGAGDENTNWMTNAIWEGTRFTADGTIEALEQGRDGSLSDIRVRTP